MGQYLKHTYLRLAFTDLPSPARNLPYFRNSMRDVPAISRRDGAMPPGDIGIIPPPERAFKRVSISAVPTPVSLTLSKFRQPLGVTPSRPSSHAQKPTPPAALSPENCSKPRHSRTLAPPVRFACQGRVTFIFAPSYAASSQRSNLNEPCSPATQGPSSLQFDLLPPAISH